MAKKCGDCKETKKITQFYISTSNKDGRMGACKECTDKKRKSKKGKGPTSSIHCPRGRGSMILRADCKEHQGCNDACFTCKHFKKDKTLNAMTLEEQREGKYSSQSVMADDYDYDDWG